LLNDRLNYLLGNYGLVIEFLNSWASEFLGDLLLVALMDNWHVLLMDDLLLPFVDDGHVLFLNSFLVNDWLYVLMNHWPVMLMHHVLVDFVDHILVVLMYDFFVSVLDNGLLHDCVNNGCLLMLNHLSGSDIRPYNRSFFVPYHLRCRDVLNQISLHHWSRW